MKPLKAFTLSRHVTIHGISTNTWADYMRQGGANWDASLDAQSGAIWVVDRDTQAQHYVAPAVVVDASMAHDVALGATPSPAPMQEPPPPTPVVEPERDAMGNVPVYRARKAPKAPKT